MNFFSRYKKVLLIFLFLAIAFIFGYLIFRVFLKPLIVPSKPSTISTTTPVTGLPHAGKGDGGNIINPEKKPELPVKPNNNTIIKKKIDNTAQGGITKTTEITSLPSANATLDKYGKSLQYYNKTDGKFYKVSSDGKIETLSSKVFYDVKKVTWSPTKDKAILEYPDGANIVYDFNKEKQVSLPTHWEDFDFSTTGKNIVSKSIGLDPRNRWLIVSDENGNQTKKIEMIGINADSVHSSWSPNNQIIATHIKGLDFNRQKVYFIGKNNENFKSITVEGRNFQSIWSHRGDKLLYSVYSTDNDMKPSLWTVNASGNKIGSERKNLNIETWATKCTYSSSDDIYCAVPNHLEKGAGIMPEMANNTIDRIYKIDNTTGIKKMIAIPDEDYNISSVIVSNDEKNLFFTDSKSGKIHKIEL